MTCLIGVVPEREDVNISHNIVRLEMRTHPQALSTHSQNAVCIYLSKYLKNGLKSWHYEFYFTFSALNTLADQKCLIIWRFLPEYSIF